MMLYPIRMDVSLQASTSQVASVRVIDTVLVDPNLCDASQIAYEAMADAQVLPVSRNSSQQLSGRVDYDLARAWREATLQVEDQLRAIRTLEQKQEQARRANVVAQSNNRKRSRDDDDAKEENPSEKTKMDPNTLVQDATATKSSGESLIPVHLRISINGMRIHDDFHWDPSLPNFTPLQMAESIAKDLNLPTDTIPAMAICIAEQIYQPLLTSSTAVPADEESPVTDDRTTAAWKIPPQRSG